MNNQERTNKARDKQIAENEAKRERVSNVRVSTWAIVAAALVCVVAVLLYLR